MPQGSTLILKTNLLRATNLLLAPNSLQSTNLLLPVTTPVQATPTFLPVAGTYSSAQDVAITSVGADTIYFTTDGSTPTTGSTVYSSPVHVATSETLKALAVKSGFTNSAIGSAAYTITAPPASATIIQSKVNDGFNVNPQTVTPNSTITTGNMVVVFVKLPQGFGAATCTGVTDDTGLNTYNLVSGPDSGDAANCYIFVCNVIAGSPTVISAAKAGSAFSSIACIVEINGASAVEAHSFDDIASATSWVGGSISAANAGDLLISFASDSTGTVLTPGSGWTDVQHGSFAAFQAFYVQLEKRIAVSPGTFAPTATAASAASGSFQTVVIAA